MGLRYAGAKCNRGGSARLPGRDIPRGLIQVAESMQFGPPVGCAVDVAGKVVVASMSSSHKQCDTLTSPILDP